MAAQISEAVTTFFTGDSSGLVDAVKKGDEALAASARKERVVADYKLKVRKELERAAALAPIKAKEAADKAADAQIKAEKEAADKITRQQKASSTSNIVKELRGNFGANAKKKLGGVLQNSLGLSEDAAEGLVGKIGKFAPYLTAAGAAGVALWKTFQAGNRFAAEQTQKMQALSEEMLQTSRINIFSSSAEGVDSLSEKLDKAKAEIRAAKEAQRENNPFGFGGGIIGNMKTAASQFQDSVRSQVGMSAYNDDEKQEDAKNTLALQQRLSGQQAAKLTKDRSEALQRELDMTRARLDADQQTVAINDLQLQKEREIASAKYATLSIDDKEKVKAKYDVQMTAQKQLRTAMEARYNLALDIQNLQLSGMNAEQQSASAAQMRLAQIKEEYNTRKDISVEERRSMAQQELGDRIILINAQRKAEEARGGSLNKQFREQRKRENQIKRDDRQIALNDGLIDIQRGASGEILSGTDRLTGQKRGPSEQYKANAESRKGLQTGSLETSGLSTLGTRDSLFGGRNLFQERSAAMRGLVTGNLNGGATRVGPAMAKNTGHDTDVKHGRTLIAAQNKLIDAANMSNAYLKNISDQMDNWGFA